MSNKFRDNCIFRLVEDLRFVRVMFSDGHVCVMYYNVVISVCLYICVCAARGAV